MDFPLLHEEYRRLVTVSNVEEYTRRSGRQPTFTDLTYSAALNGVMCPLWLPTALFVKKVGVFNGSVANGNHGVALAQDAFYAWQSLQAMAGTNAIQWFTVPNGGRWLAPGWAWVGHATDSGTAKFFSLISTNTGNDGEGQYPGGSRWTAWPPGSAWGMNAPGPVPILVLSGLAP